MPRYFRTIPPRDGLAKVYIDLVRAERAYRLRAYHAEEARHRSALLRKAALVRRTLRDIQRAYEKLAGQMATYADERARHHIKDTAVRPLGNEGATTGRMSRGVVSRPLPVTTLPGGAVGIADLDVLSRATMRPGATEPYWRAQEYGYAGHVGRKIPGWFSDAPVGGNLSAPGDAPSRTHPYFQVTAGDAYEPRKTPVMVINEPIEARHFLQRTTDDTYAEWRLRAAALERQAVTPLVTARRM